MRKLVLFVKPEYKKNESRSKKSYGMNKRRKLRNIVDKRNDNCKFFLLRLSNYQMI